MDGSNDRRTRVSAAGAVGAGAVAVAGLLVWIATRSGPGVTNDSVAYLATAQHLAHEGRLTNFDGQRLSIFPPGYSTVVAAMLRAGIPTQLSIQVLGIATAMFVVAAARRLGRELGLTPMAASLAALFVAVNTGLVLVHAMAWSEPLFVSATLVALIALTRLHRVRRLEVRTVAVLALATGLAGVTRYTGIVLVGVIGAVVLADHWHRGRLRAIRSAAVVSALCSWGIAAVIAVNVTDGRPPMGQRGGGATFTFGETMTQLATSIGRYALGGQASEGAMRTVGWLALVGVVALGIRTAAHLARGPGAVWAAAGAPVAAYVSAYVAFLVVSEMTTMLNQVDARLLAPVFAPTVVLLALPVERAVAAWRARPADERALGRPRPALAAVALVALAALLGSTAAETTAWSSKAGTTGIRLNAVRKRRAPWVDVVKALPRDAAVVADDPYSVRWLGTHEPVTPIPGRAFYAWVPFRPRLLEVRQFVTDHGGGYLVLTEGPNEEVVQSMRWVGLDVQPYRVEPGLEVYRLAPPTELGPGGQGVTP
ncbi:hypothetical protein [Aquihabitans sp. McL0605]|uniref:hypothetical protein n=1 Tax=Aquihabitans sp. McL0605 TaxID=3415671 RepID=UPI003CE7E7B4